MKTVLAQEAVKQIKSNQQVFVQGSAATPLHLLRALEQRAAELQNVQIISISLLGDIGINKEAYAKSFFFNLSVEPNFQP